MSENLAQNDHRFYSGKPASNIVDNKTQGRNGYAVGPRQAMVFDTSHQGQIYSKKDAADTG